MNYLTVKEVALDIKCNPQSLREQIWADASKVGFPVCIVGQRIYIPKGAYETWRDGLQKSGKD